VLADPGGQDVPLHALAAVDADPQLRVLVLAGLREVGTETPFTDIQGGLGSQDANICSCAGLVC
jgi:hypothetical protein